MLDVTGAEIRIPQKPSEVFLKAIQALAIADPEMPGTEFKEYAEAWRQICHLEELYAAAERKIRWENLLAEWTPKAGEDKKGPGDPSPSAQDDSPKAVTYDCASAPMPEEAAKAAAKSAAGVSGLATRKRRALERLEAVRERGISMAEVTAAGPGLTLNDVLDALDRKPLPLPKLAALEKALAVIEGGDQSAPPSRKRGRKVTADDG